MGSSNGKYVLTSQDLHYLSKYTGMGEHDIRVRFEQFCQNYPDGKIPKDEYMTLLTSCYSKTDVAQLEEYVLSAYDMNGDGWVDFKEFLFILFTLSGGTPKEKLSQIFRISDLDNNGFITKEEVNKLVKDLFHLLGTPFIHILKSNICINIVIIFGVSMLYSIYNYLVISSVICKGRIDNPDKLNPDDMAEVAFDEMDYNHDGHVTKDEFVKACIGNDKIIASLAFKMLDVVSTDCQ